jgi:hypothetical protein
MIMKNLKGKQGVILGGMFKTSDSKVPSIGVSLHKILNLFIFYKIRTVEGFLGIQYYIKPTTVRRICSDSCEDI